MNDKQESIDDIVWDIRALNQGLPEGSYSLSPLVCDLLSLADRIEAAHQREIDALKSPAAPAPSGAIGDPAKLREALKQIFELAKSKGLFEIQALAETALAAPPSAPNPTPESEAVA